MLSGVLFEVQMAVRAHLFKIDGTRGHAVWAACAGGVLVRAFLHLDGRTQEKMQFGVLLMVLWDTVCGELFEVLCGAHRACR